MGRAFLYHCIQLAARRTQSGPSATQRHGVPRTWRLTDSFSSLGPLLGSDQPLARRPQTHPPAREGCRIRPSGPCATSDADRRTQRSLRPGRRAKRAAFQRRAPSQARVCASTPSVDSWSPCATRGACIQRARDTGRREKPATAPPPPPFGFRPPPSAVVGWPGRRCHTTTTGWVPTVLCVYKGPTLRQSPVARAVGTRRWGAGGLRPCGRRRLQPSRWPLALCRHLGVWRPCRDARRADVRHGQCAGGHWLRQQLRVWWRGGWWGCLHWRRAKHLHRPPPW